MVQEFIPSHQPVSINTLNIQQQSNMTENIPAQHVCSQCNNVYKSPTYLAMHIKAKHETKPDLNCDFCEFKTSSTNVLKTHKNTTHGELSFRCDLCTFQVRRPGELEKHLTFQTIFVPSVDSKLKGVMT